MYCSSCGVSVARGLSYCNHCGAKLNGEKGDSLVKTMELRSESLIILLMVGLFVFGLLAISVLMGVMKSVLDLNAGQILGFATLSFLIMLLIEGVLIWRLSRRKRGAGATGDTALSKEQTTKELDAARARALPEAMASVTEHTTRTLEPLYSERKSK
jgi:hypothetical protein